ncbi:MAG: M20 family peptidase [Alphaproteobacteria bacterium]|nr:M20 family peptidase [Alphaproteobacteria bacterium]
MAANADERDILGWLDGQRDAMVELLRDLVNIDSGSYNKAGVDQVGAVIEAHLAERAIPTERVRHDRFGDCIRAMVPAAAGGGNRHVMLMGHRDTVFPDGTVAERPFRVEGDVAYGPGVADMKSGLVLNTFVLAAFKRHGGARFPLVGLYTSDEEIASPSSRPVIEAEARNARVVFNSEPGRISGNVVTGRKGAVFFKFEIAGKAAHSGGRPQDGVSAIEELAAKIRALHALTDFATGITVNVGLIAGGSSVNTVAPHASAEVDLRFMTLAQRDQAMAAIGRILATTHLPGTTTQITQRREFLPLNQSADSKAVFDLYRGVAKEVGFQVAGEFTGGSADSGFTAHVGAPTLCATGPVGGGAHSPEEYCNLDTLVPRAKALALAIIRLDG